MKRAGLTGRVISDQGYAVMAGKGAFAGAYGVVSTGIVCVAGCPARVPHQRNVLVYTDVGRAVAEGFRVCKRCGPRTGDIRGGAPVLDCLQSEEDRRQSACKLTAVNS